MAEMVLLHSQFDRTEEVGIHQDGTLHLDVVVGTTGGIVAMSQSGVSDKATNYDETNEAIERVQYSSTTGSSKITRFNKYTSRPTNVAVLFCIKYTENNTINTNVAFSQTNILFTNEQERIISKQGRLVNFSLNSTKGFTNIVADRWVKIGEVPEEYKPAEPAGFALATYSPNTTGYGKVDSADGSIYVYFNSTLNNNTQLFANVTYSV